MAGPFVRRGTQIHEESVDAADGLSKAVLLGEDQGAENVAIRRFTLDPHSSVPRHTNEVEHEQYVLSGQYVVGLGRPEDVTDERALRSPDSGPGRYEVGPGDAIHIPAGAVHWYENDGDEPATFLCAVPTGDDEIQLVD